MAGRTQTRIVVVTGAGAGVGRAVAEEFARAAFSSLKWPARAIRFAAEHRRRTLWPTARAIAADLLAPGLVDRYLAKAGYRGQLTDEPRAADAPDNLYAPVAGRFGAHGRFDGEARTTGAPLFTDRHVQALKGGVALGLIGAALLYARLIRRPRS